MSNIVGNREFWIYQHNLTPTLQILSNIAGYDFVKIGIEAILYGVTGTSKDKGAYWDFALVGDRVIDLSMARDDDDGDIIFVELTFRSDLSAQIDLAIFVVQEFELTHQSFTDSR